MTNEEAIKKLKSFCHNCSKYPQCVNTDRECFEALDMAIEALKQTDGDLISRQSVITMLNKIENAVEDGDGFQFNEWVEYAKDIPSAEKTAEWIKIGKGIKVTEYKCSACGRVVRDDTDYDVVIDYPYCHCGCRMKGEEGA